MLIAYELISIQKNNINWHGSPLIFSYIQSARIYYIFIKIVPESSVVS